MFFCAILFNFISSYLIASLCSNFLIIFIAYFALIVLNMEILSLFSAINEINLLIFSFLNLILSFSFFKFKKGKFLKPKFDIKRFINSLLLDKSLIFLSLSFIILIFSTLFLAIVTPAIEPDFQTYHFLRAWEFVKNQNLLHFETNDIRALIMPINSEIIYAWMLVFKKNFYGYGIISYLSYILVIFASWQIFEKFKFSYRKRLFAIFIFSSLCAIIVQIPSMQTNILIGALLLSSFSLFLFNSKKTLYFSSLALSLAIGTKTTAIIALLGFFSLIMGYEILIEKNKKLEKTKLFLIYLIINFFVFSSYNYILNLVQFHNPFSNNAAYQGHKFWGGFRGYIANLINFFIQAFDFTGFKWGLYLNSKILIIKKEIFNLLNMPLDIGTNVNLYEINIGTDEQVAGFGILGFLAFLPMVFISFVKFFFNKNKRTILLFLLAFAFLINILILAYSCAFMIFSIRFIVSFICLSFLVLASLYSKKNILKPIIIFFCIFYMTLIPFFIQRMPFGAILNNLKRNNYDIEKLSIDSFSNKIIPVYELGYTIKNTVKTRYKNQKNIAIIKNLESPAFYALSLDYEGYNVDFLVGALLNQEKLKKYDLIIALDDYQNDNVFNIEDVLNTKYTVDENNNVRFDKTNKLNCYFKFIQLPDNENVDEKNAVERVCYTTNYLSKLYKLDYIEYINPLMGFKKIKLLYFKG